MIDINYHHLYYFYTVATEGTISKASRKLFLGQPTISTQLRQLESSLKRKLFDRRGRRLVLTPAGRVVLSYAESIFRIGRELTEYAHGRRAPSLQTLRIGVASGIPKAFSHAAMRCVLTEHPAARISCIEAPFDALVSKLDEFKLDILLTDNCHGLEPEGRFEVRRVGRVPVLFVGSPTLVRTDSKLPHSLEKAPLLLPQAPVEVARQVGSYLATNGIRARIVADVPDAETAGQLAVSGFGLAPLDVYSFAVSRAVKELDIVGRGQRTGLFETVA